MASTEVAARIAEIQTMMDDALAKSNSFLDLMKNELNFEVDPIEPPMGWFIPNNVDLSDVPVPDRPDLAMPEIAVPNDVTVMPEFTIPFPIEEVLTIPADFSFNEQTYVSQLLTDVTTWLRNGVANGGTGLDADVEQDIFDRQSERDLQVYLDAANRIRSDWSARGFSQPNDVVNARLEELDDKYRMVDLDRSRDIAIKQAELAQTNTHFIISSSLTLEGLTLGHHENMMNRALEAAKAIVDGGVAVLNAMIQRYNARLDAYKTRAITFTELEKAKLEYQMTRIRRWQSIVEGQVARIRGLTDIYQADASIYNSVINKKKLDGDLKIQQQEMMVRQHEAYMDRALESAKVNLQKLVSQTQFKVTATTEGGRVYAHLAASATNAINAIVQLVETVNSTA